MKPLGRENNDIENKLSEEKNYVQTKITRGDVRTRHRFINYFHSNGADALGCYEANRPDWVLMDWEMRTDGLTATRRIVKAHPEARILIVTQHGEELRDAAIEAGARGFVLKDDLLALGSFLQER